MAEILLALALGATALSNFPRDAAGRISQPAIAVQLGGAPAVVVAAGDTIAAFRADGGAVPGFPVALGDEAVGAPAAADMDGDGRLEIAVATASGKLFVVSGGNVPGFPVSLGAPAKAGPSFADVDGDHKLEVLVGDANGLVHAFKRGGGKPRGWPATVGSAVTSPVSSSVSQGVRTFAVGCMDGRVHLLDGAGRERPGFPLVTKFAVSGSPAFGDVDDDGEMDLVVASQDFGVYAVSSTGALLPGFPVKAGYRLYEGAALADLDGDERLEIVFASADGMIHAVNGSGRKLPGFPVRAGTRLFGGAVIGDLDRDGSPDIVAVAADGTVAAFDRKGKPLAGFPSYLQSAEVSASPILLDTTRDGSLAVFVGVPTGQLHALRAERSGSAPVQAPWPAPGRDPARTARFGPNAPSYRDLALTPAQPRVSDSLQAGWRGIWLDAAPGEGAPTPRLEWLRNGKVVPGLDGKRQLPAGTAKRGEKWRFALAYGAGSRAESPEVVVRDTAPGAPAVALDPAEPTRAKPVRATVARAAQDADGDALTYKIEWLLDGLETGIAGETFPGDRLRKGSVIKAVVVATDGEMSASPATAQARVGDTAPGALQVSLEPKSPGRTDQVRARIESPAQDPDGDALVYRYRWKVGGASLNLPVATAALPAGSFRKHQKIEVEVRAFDGLLEGPSARAEVMARNTAPFAPRVEIRPAKPRKGEALHAVVVAVAEDPDGDAQTYRFSWKKNDQPLQVEGDERTVQGAQVARADRFELSVTSSDGEVSSPSATASVTVANTPPSPPRIAIEPLRPKGGEPLKLVVIEPAKDVDGQKVSLGIAWTREGRPTGTGGDVLAPSNFRKHERIRVAVTPNDGQEAGPVARFEVEVDDAPPGAPVAALGPARPDVTHPLVASVKTSASDADGDALVYQYRWIRDGAPVTLTDGSARSTESPFWTTISQVPANLLKKGQRWNVEIRASDGEKTGPVGSASTTVANSPPPSPNVRFVPDRPRRVDGIRIAIDQPPDADGDPVTYRYSWTRNGERFETPGDQAQIARGVAKKGQRWAVEVVASDGEAESAPVRQEVAIADTAPGPTALALCDGPVPAGTVPQARITLASVDPDGDPVTYQHEWTVNGKPVPSMSGQARLTSPALRKHDRVRVVVTPYDGELAGPRATGDCDVANTPPTAPVAALEPADPTSARGVSVAIRKPSADRDGDPVSYRYVWRRDGVEDSHTGAAIPGGVLRHGEIWQVEVTPFDGEDAGEHVTLATVVENTVPPVPTVAVAPAAPVAGEPISCDARAPDLDADREPVNLRYRWLRNEHVEALGDGGAKLPTGVVRHGERWRCEAWTWDGFTESGRAGADATARNSAPAAPQVTIEPDVPRRGDDLFCRIVRAAPDPDGDDVTYAYSWSQNGRRAPPGADPARIEASRTAKGQKWSCTATPSDGSATGAAGTSERVVANSPPGPAMVQLTPATAEEGRPIRCDVVSKSEDPDGDAVRYRFSWQRNGLAQPFAETSQEVPARLVKARDRWRCTATPTDGSDDGPPAGSEDVLVAPAAAQPTAALPP